MPRPGIVATAGFCLLVAGCQNLPPLPEPVPTPPPVPPERLVQPLDAELGRVLSVNARLRFVVLDYSLSPLPATGTRLDLVRAGAVIGELKVTGPVRNNSVVADIVNGEPQAGDLTRPQRVSAVP